MKRINCKLTPNQNEESYYHQLYNSHPEEELMPTSKLNKWNDYPFQFDTHLFMDSDKDTIIEDLFETLDIKERIVRPTKNGFQHIEKMSFKYEKEIEDRLEAAHPITWNQELPFENQYDERARGSQLNRQIMEDCTFSDNNRIKLPQLSQPGDCRIDAHLKIEEMAKFMKITHRQAKILARIYKTLDIDFNMAVFKKFGKKKRQSLNMHIRDFVKRTKRPPWEIQLKEGKTLMNYYQEVKNITEWNEQEDPDWSYDPDFRIDTKYAFMAHLADGEEYTIKNPDDIDEEIDNPVGLYTYHYMTRIPDATEYLGHHGKRFKKLIEKAHKLDSKGIETADKWVRKHKREGIQGKNYNKMYYKRIETWEKTLRQIQNERARKGTNRKPRHIVAKLAA
jgi:hypothetical protein